EAPESQNPETDQSPDQTEEPAPVPTLAELAPDFREHVKLRNAQKPETVRFYNNKLDRLLEYKPLASARLDLIDEQLIEAYVALRRKKGRSPATCNRELATLRKLMRWAMNFRKILKSVPTFDMLDGEVQRDYVLSREDEATYLAKATGHLKDSAL